MEAPEILIVIVDDNDGVRHLVSRWLTKSGFRVVEAQDGIEALHLLEQMKPRIVLADIRMPGMDGIALAQEIKKNDPECGIILMTAYSSPSIMTRAREHGVDDYLEKPFTRDQVFKVLKKYLDSK